MAMDYETVAKQFVEFYYQTFDANRGNLASLYRPQSMLTFETNLVQGGPNIVEKLQSLPFGKIQHKASTLDAQPTGANNDQVLCMVTGAMVVDQEEKPMSFVQTFLLVPDGGSYFILNDVFKLVFPG